jgi:hypothetical protein
VSFLDDQFVYVSARLVIRLAEPRGADLATPLLLLIQIVSVVLRSGLLLVVVVAEIYSSKLDLGKVEGPRDDRHAFYGLWGSL